MKVFYTFGSSENFPFQNGYSVVEGVSIEDCHKTFRAYHPDGTEGTLNCSFFYNEQEWESVKSSFEGQEPFETLISPAADKPYQRRVSTPIGDIVIDTFEGCEEGEVALAFSPKGAAPDKYIYLGAVNASEPNGLRLFVYGNPLMDEATEVIDLSMDAVYESCGDRKEAV